MNRKDMFVGGTWIIAGRAAGLISRRLRVVYQLLLPYVRTAAATLSSVSLSTYPLASCVMAWMRREKRRRREEQSTTDGQEKRGDD